VVNKLYRGRVMPHFTYGSVGGESITTSEPMIELNKSTDDVIGNIVIFRGMSDINGNNIDFLVDTVNKLINIVNEQSKHIKAIQCNNTSDQ
jgi:hypothetical protein